MDHSSIYLFLTQIYPSPLLHAVSITTRHTPRQPSPCGQGVEDLTAIKKMTENAVEMEQAAERLKLLVSQVAKGTAMDKATSDNKRNDIRLAGAGLSRAYPPLGRKPREHGKVGISLLVSAVDTFTRKPRELRAQSGQPAF